jgi:hypothetical protein
MPDMTQLKTEEKETDNKSGSGGLPKALALLMQFVEKAESHVEVLAPMPIDDKAKWEATVAMYRREIPPLKKEVSACMLSTIENMIRKTDTEA